MARARSKMKTRPAKGKKGGQPSGIADKLKIKKFLGYLKKGHHVEVAAKCSRIAPRTIYAWMKRGTEELKRLEETESKPDEAERAFAEFMLDVDAAEATAEETLLNTVRNASKKMWQAAAWILERTRPQRYAKWYAFANKEKLPVDKGLDHMTEQELDAEIDEVDAELQAVQDRRTKTEGKESIAS